MTAGHAQHSPAQPPAAEFCCACKTAPAVITGAFDRTTGRETQLDWCETCAVNIVPVLVYAGYSVSLFPVEDQPAELCNWGEHCGRLARDGFRYCTDHLADLEDTYLTGDDAATRPPAREPWCILCRRRHAGNCRPVRSADAVLFAGVIRT